MLWKGGGRGRLEPPSYPFQMCMAALTSLGTCTAKPPQSRRPHGVFLCSHLKNLSSSSLWQQFTQKGAFPFLLFLGCPEDTSFAALLSSPAVGALLSKTCPNTCVWAAHGCHPVSPKVPSHPAVRSPSTFGGTLGQRSGRACASLLGVLLFSQ